MARSAIERSFLRQAGIHFVLSRLYQQGMLASPSPAGSATVDVVVLAGDETVVATLQVVTRSRGDAKGWEMNRRHERIRVPTSFHAFVDLEVKQGMMPITYVVPSSEVANVLVASHKAWLAVRGHRDSPMRRVKTAHSFHVPGYPNGWMEKYREAWHQLSAAAIQKAEPLNNGEFGATVYPPALLPTPPGT